MKRDSPGPLPIAAGGAGGAKLVARFLSEPRSTIISLSRNAWSAFRSSHFVTLAALGATICVRNGNRWIYTAKIIRIYDKQPSTAFAVKGRPKRKQHCSEQCFCWPSISLGKIDEMESGTYPSP